jgi:outer membrane protein
MAQDKYSLRVAHGKATISDFSEIIVANWKGHPNDLRVYAVDGGYLLVSNYRNLPLDIYLKGGLSYFDEDGIRNNVYEANTYIKAYWKFDVLGKKMRFGIGEGFSYTSAILYTEFIEARDEHDFNSAFLNYLDVSLDVNVGSLLSYETLNNTNIGWALKHRSGIFGLINNVRRGGGNYNTFYIEATF